MKIGCVKEIKNREYRVGLIPDNAKSYVNAGHEVWIEKGAGLGSGFTDAEYEKAGAKLVDTAKEEHASLVCLSTLMTTTMGGMETVIHLLEEAGIRNQVKVMIGGGPISQKYADKIGADGYSQNAVEAVKLAKRLLNIA